MSKQEWPPGIGASCVLAALPEDVRDRLMPQLTRVSLALREVLHAQDALIQHAYFPESCMISLVANLEDGGMSEVGLIGHEGAVGLPLLARQQRAFTEAIVQIAGTALRMTAASFRHEFETSAPFRAVLLRCNDYQLAQISQSSVCNGRHDLEQRLARWLLMAHDGVEGDTLLLTQEFLAVMLGVHRPSVTLAARSLQRSGLISYTTGVITIMDRDGLEATCCECYGAVRRHLARLWGLPAPRIITP